MKIIDEKGRLFRKINVVDLFVVVLAGVLVLSFVINLLPTIKSRRNAVSEATHFNLYVKVLYTKVSNYVLDNKKVLRAGDTFLAGQATVEKILTVVPLTDKTSDVIVLAKVNCTKLRGENYCANIPIKINSLLSIENESYVLRDGLILNVGTGTDAAN